MIDNCQNQIHKVVEEIEQQWHFHFVRLLVYTMRVCMRGLIGYPATLPAKLKLSGGASCRDILPLCQCWDMRPIRTFRVIMCLISHQLLEL
ncbi:hypothetical protein BHE74_00032077 [Ensete ventricosum]|nr:hypothetical protein GW17_00036652 [Ensete ventricosum]RWW60908.1 hypothetical protein BHE74_00032077 [Ensete ventricosum]RZR84718.1 hypothetical protein BHM03_00011588 [Ensete ventricosum]